MGKAALRHSSESGRDYPRSDLSLDFRFNRLALIELDDAATEYESQSTELGERFVDAVEHTIAQLCDYPKLAPAIRTEIRRMVVPGFPYSILYRVHSGHIRILALAHQRRHPFYWLRRT